MPKEMRDDWMLATWLRLAVIFVTVFLVGVGKEVHSIVGSMLIAAGVVCFRLWMNAIDRRFGSSLWK